MKISVITVAYNAAATLPDTLRSVAAQDWPNVEHILIDGGSRDATHAVVAEHGSHLAHFVSEPDKGLYDAMNKGIALATGDVIGLLNADDVYCDTTSLSKVAAAFAAKPGVDAVLGDVAFFRPGAPDKIVRRYDSGHFRPDRIAYGWMPAHPGMYLTRDAYARAGAYRTDFRIASDFEMVARVFGRMGMSYAYLPEILVMMQLGGISTAGVSARWRLSRETVRACRDNGIDTNLAKVLTKYIRKVRELRL